MIPKMPVPGLDPGMDTGFRKRSCSTKMLAERCKSVAQRRAGNRQKTGERFAQFQDQEDRARRRQSKQRQKAEYRGVQCGEQAEAREYDDEPERQYRDEGRRNGAIGFYEQEQAGLYKVGADLRRPRLQRALQVVVRRQRLNRQV